MRRVTVSPTFAVVGPVIATARSAWPATSPPPPPPPPPPLPPPPAGASGVTAFEGAEAGPVAIAFEAVTVNVYAVPDARPVTVIGLAPPVDCAPPGEAVTVYDVVSVAP